MLVKQKSIAYAYASSPVAEKLNAPNGCFYISGEAVRTCEYTPGKHTPPYVAHNVGYDKADDPEMIDLFLNLEGSLTPYFRKYGNKDALNAIRKGII